MRLILVLCALLSSSSVLAAGARVFQNFSNDAGGWSALDPSNHPWSVVSGYYRNDIASSGAATSITLYSASRQWQDNFVYSFDIYSSYSGTGNQLGAIFGYTSAGNYYEVLTNIQGDVTVRRYAGGAETWIATGNVPAFPADTFVPMRLSLMNGSLSIHINGQATAFYNGTPNLGVTPVNGRIGLVTRSDLGRFDNVNVVERIFRGNFTDKDTGQGLSISGATINCSPVPDNPPTEKTCYAEISGNDSSGYSWPIKMWGDGESGDPDGHGALLQYIPHITTGAVTDYLGATIEQQLGHAGSMTHVLHQQIKQQGTSGSMTPQIPYIIRPRNTFSQQHDLYMRFWLKYPDALTGWWQMPWQFKTPGSNTADPAPSNLRVSLLATNTDSHNGVPCPGATDGDWHWLVQADPGVGMPGNVKWQACHPTADVPIGEWFKVEIFFRRATSATGSGRVWVAIGGNVIIDYLVDATHGGMYAEGSPIDRIMLPQMYGGAAWPRNQYVDDLEIWNGFPADATNPH